MIEGTAAVFVGIGGGSGSGKTRLARAVQRALPSAVSLIELDWYYRDQSHIPFEERMKTNYDHPDALDLGLLLTHLDALRAGAPVDAPEYLYDQHVRGAATRRVPPSQIVLIEGLLALSYPPLRSRLAVKVFMDTPAAVRLERRLARDLAERGRAREDVMRQYTEQVLPMHEAWVEPARARADIVVSGEEPTEQAAARVCAAIEASRDG